MFGFNRSKINTKRAEENFKKTLEKEPLEKGDLPAMIIAGLIIVIPAILIAIGIVALCAWLLIGR